MNLTTDDADGKIRLDQYLAAHLPELSRSRIQSLIKSGDVLVNGSPAKPKNPVSRGDSITVRIPEPEPAEAQPQDIPLDIVYEDGDLLILNKAPGVPVHPGPGHFNDTIGNFLLNYYDSEGIEGDFPPVHRLDRGTSGLMAVAKHPHAQEVLKGQLHTPAFRRVYLAVCDGGPQPPSGVVDAPLGPREGSLVEQMVRPDGKDARTRYETLSRSGGRSLVRLELDTGRTHQIRVHMASLGCPLTGDFLYGYEDRSLISRPALHSAQLSLRQPVTGQELSFTLPLPEDMARLLTHQKGEKEP